MTDPVALLSDYARVVPGEEPEAVVERARALVPSIGIPTFGLMPLLLHGSGTGRSTAWTSGSRWTGSRR